MTGASGQPEQYMRQLDALRAAAVGMVIVSHWVPSRTSFLFNGDLGVKLFFVISGFLITGILLDARGEAEQRGVTTARVLKGFYARRFLRIFPLFYATLLVTCLAGYPAVRATIWWHVTYLSNFLFALRGEWLGEVSHLWSLAVEEQFYLFWPCVILFSPRRLLLPLVAAAIVSAPLFRFIGYSAGLNDLSVSVLPLSSLDTLGLGALLAFLKRSGKAHAPLYPLGLLGLCAYVLDHITGFSSRSLLGSALAPSLLALPLAAAVSLAADRVGGSLGRILEMGPIVYLGRISYGLYIFHNFVPRASSGIFAMAGYSVTDPLGPYALLFLNAALLGSVSVLSWHFFEKPINGLKRFFPYVR